MNKNGLLIVTTKQNKMCGPWFFIFSASEIWDMDWLWATNTRCKCSKMLIDSIENIIFGGDFDCPLNPAVVKRGGNIFPRRSVIAAIEHLQSELDVYDIWRIKNPTTRSYTWSQSEPLIFSRLDYWLTSNSLSDNVSSVYIIPSIKTDHSIIEFQDLGDKAKGPDIWKFNCSLLSENLYVEQINSLIPT